jgi:hypothetical protein
MAKLLRADGVEFELRPQNRGKGFTIAELHRMLGGPLQLVPVDSELILVTSLANRRPSKTNRKATQLILRVRMVRRAGLDITRIRGDVVLLNYHELDMKQLFREDVIVN